MYRESEIIVACHFVFIESKYLISDYSAVPYLSIWHVEYCYIISNI